MQPFREEYSVRSAFFTTSVYHWGKSSSISVMDSTNFFSFAIGVSSSIKIFLFFRIPEGHFSIKKAFVPTQRDQGIIGGATLLDSAYCCPLEIR